ncbi:exo-alpha-sialidase [Candidatus Aerophobetes bacterium]|nr:exo-alpha-sialidase [Candidatus Aerophobetes bacterium]
MKKIRLLPPAKNNPRNSEGSILKLKDGSLLLAYTHFYGGARDNSPAYIAARFSQDGGETWSKKDTLLIKNEGKENVMSVSLLRLASGEISLGYMVKNSWKDCRFYLRKSNNEGESWGERICAISEKGYFVVNNDRLVQLSSGRIIVPAAYHTCEDGTFNTWSPRGVAMCFYSDDNGKTWERSKTILEAPGKSKSGLQEPGVIELKNGSLMMWARTDLGSQYISYSKDEGNTWSKAFPSEIISPCSPASIKRIPQTDDLLLIYNDHSGRFPYRSGKRTPLVAAISKDEGNTWQNHKLLENEPDGWYCYTAITFLKEKVILAYCAGNSKIGGLNLLQITLFDYKWLYKG